jgi:hypothetical protein
MPVRRAVPRAPLTSHLWRRVARVPAGGATGFACAAAGLACAIGLVVVRPQVDLPGLFDPRPDRAPTATSAPAAPTVRQVTGDSRPMGHARLADGGDRSNAAGGRADPPLPSATPRVEEALDRPTSAESPPPAPSLLPAPTDTSDDPPTTNAHDPDPDDRSTEPDQHQDDRDELRVEPEREDPGDDEPEREERPGPSGEPRT